MPLIRTTILVAAGVALGAALVPCARYDVANATPPAQPPARMVSIPGKDLSGTVYKKLGLPSLKYCWEACLKEDACAATRWGVIEGDEAGLCVMLRAPVETKRLSQPKTDDGKRIRIIVAKKELLGSADGA